MKTNLAKKQISYRNISKYSFNFEKKVGKLMPFAGKIKIVDIGLTKCSLGVCLYELFIEIDGVEICLQYKSKGLLDFDLYINMRFLNPNKTLFDLKKRITLLVLNQNQNSIEQKLESIKNQSPCTISHQLYV